MKKPLIAVTAFLVLFPLFAFSGSESYNGVGFARMSYVKGDVFIQRGQNLGYEQGEINLALTEGDKLGSRDGQAEIQFGNRNYLRIDANTQVDIVALPNGSSDQIKLHLLSGSVYLRVNELASEKGIEVHTPDASYYILEQGLYRLDVRENKETDLKVFEGSAEAASEQGSQLVRGREQLIASDGAIVSGPAGFSAGYDDFSRFNDSRDALFARKSPRSYLPSQLDEYQEELDNNGRWVSEQPYGNVWVPNVYDADWRPYYYGRWDWYPMAGWTWISSEPWGWCTYHYGRWHWRFGLGWYWIPTSIWGPAWVDWCWGNDYIGWCPLSYYNTPGVIINNRFYDRFHGRDYPFHSRALTVIHRDHLQSPYVNRHALAEDRVRSLGRISLGHEQPNIRPLAERAGLNRSLAEKTLDRSNLRGVARGSGQVKGLTPSQLRPSAIKSGVRGNERLSGISPRDVRDRSGVREFSRTGKSQGSVSGSSVDSRRTRTGQGIKTYPSRRSFSSFFSSRFSSASSRTNPANSSRNIRSYNRNSSVSSRTSPSYRSGSSSSSSRVREYRSSSRVYSRDKSSTSSPQRRSSSAYIRQDGRNSGSRSLYTQRYSSPSHSYSYPYRNGSSSWRNSSYSSPRSYYSPRSSGSSSYSRPSYSSRSSRSLSSASRSHSSSSRSSARSSSRSSSSSSSRSHSGSVRKK